VRARSLAGSEPCDGLDGGPLGIGRRLVPLALEDRRRSRAFALLVKEKAELLVEPLLAPFLAAHPPLVTHVDHLGWFGDVDMIAPGVPPVSLVTEAE
jgi:hypothetical protein